MNQEEGRKEEARREAKEPPTETECKNKLMLRTNDVVTAGR